MSTINDYRDDLDNQIAPAVLQAINPISLQSYWSEEGRRTALGSMSVKVVSAEVITETANQSETLVTAELRLFYGTVIGSRLTQFGGAVPFEESFSDSLEVATDVSRYSALASVSSARVPEVTVTKPIELVGGFVTYTVTATCGLAA